MTIKLWKNFSKRKNSTKQPSAASATDVTAVLKDNCSIESPRFIITGVDFDWNYAQAFGHYYTVDDIIVLNASQIELVCSQDVLATYKSAITGSSQYVLYDTTTNNNLIDRRLNQSSACVHQTNSTAFRDDTSTSGTYILTVTGEDGVGVYAVPRSTLNRIYPNIETVYNSYIQGTDPFDGINAGFMQLISSGSLGENIKDVRWIPFTVAGDTLVNPLKVGKYVVYSESAVPIGAMRIDSRLSSQSKTVNIPLQFNDWRDSEPYTSITLYIPFVGNINIPASQIRGITQLSVFSVLDKWTGDLAIEVLAGSNVIGTYGAATGVSAFVGKSEFSPMNIVAGAASIVAGATTGNVGAVGAGLVGAFTPFDTTVGGISNAAGVGLTLNLVCSTHCHNTNVEPSSVSPIMGTPTYAYKSLSGLSGYVQCANASVNIAGRTTDRDEVNAALDSGIYIE